MFYSFIYLNKWTVSCTFSEKAMATHSSTLAWRIPWAEEPGRLQSMRLLRVGHDWASSLKFSLSCIGEGNGNPLQCSCLENPGVGGASWAAVYRVTQSRTRMKWAACTFHIQAFSNYILQMNHLGILLKCKFWLSGSVLGPENLHSSKLPDGANAAGLQATLCITSLKKEKRKRSCSVVSDSLQPHGL